MPMGMRFLVGRFTGLVVLVREGKEFDETETLCTPCWFGDSISFTGVEEIASSGAFASFYPWFLEKAY